MATHEAEQAKPFSEAQGDHIPPQRKESVRVVHVSVEAQIDTTDVGLFPHPQQKPADLKVSAWPASCTVYITSKYKT